MDTTPRSGQVEEWERPHLERLGAEVRRLRRSVGLSQRALERRMGRDPSGGHGLIPRIEAGTRRTRASTLEELAKALYRAGVREDPWGLAEWLAGLAGPALAPERDPIVDRIWRGG